MNITWPDRGAAVGRAMMRVRAEDQRVLDALIGVLRAAGVRGELPRTSLWRIAARMAIGESAVAAARTELGAGAVPEAAEAAEAPAGVSAS